MPFDLCRVPCVEFLLLLCKLYNIIIFVWNHTAATMVFPALESALLANKFRGCMLGSLLGDCLGAPFENESVVSKVVLQKYFDTIEAPSSKCK